MGGLDDYDEKTGDAHRAIGRYVVKFSELVQLMRESVCQYVAKGVTDMHISSLLLGEATPQIIANSFFGMCRYVGELDDDEDKVWRVLRRDVKRAIETRNDIAHGDWAVGWVRLQEGVEPQLAPPQLVRIIPARNEGPRKVLNLAIGDIDDLAGEIDRLLALVQDFGCLALKLPVFAVAPDGHSRVSVGEYHVRDVLVTVGGKRDTTARIEWSGPEAGNVNGGSYSYVYNSPVSAPSSSRSSASD